MPEDAADREYRRWLDEQERLRRQREDDAYRSQQIVAQGGVPTRRTDLNDLYQAGLFGDPNPSPRSTREPSPEEIAKETARDARRRDLIMGTSVALLLFWVILLAWGNVWLLVLFTLAAPVLPAWALEDEGFYFLSLALLAVPTILLAVWWH